MERNFGFCMDVLLNESGNALSSQLVTKEQLVAFQGKLPNLLLKFWQDQGWGSYYDGLLWTVNPEDYRDVLAEWVRDTPYEHETDNHVIARTAFGDLYVWNGTKGFYFHTSSSAHWLIPGTGDTSIDAERLEKHIDIFFSVVDEENIDEEDENGKPLFKRALKKLGPLEANEMYGFEPALCLGGSPILKNLKKVDIFAHLSLLADLQPTEVLEFDDLEEIMASIDLDEVIDD